MSEQGTVRVYVGTRKGGYVVTGDKGRKKWRVSGPSHEGRDVYHMSPDPRRPGTVFALVNSPWWGPMVVRSTDHGKTWREVAPPMMKKSKERPAPGPDGPAKNPIVNLWHLEPGPDSDPSTYFLGVDPASLYRTDDRGESWAPVTALNEHETRSAWNPGAGGLCLHTILIDPTNPRRMYVGISAAGTFRSDDGGDHWQAMNRGVKISFLPEKNPPVGQCVHDVAMDPATPSTLYRQDHDGIYVSRDSAESWKHVGGPLHSDFGFVVVAPPAMPGSAFFVPLEGATRTIGGHGLQVQRWDERTRRWSALVKGSPFPGDFGMHREGFATDPFDPAGLYLGTSTGQLFISPDAGRRWLQVPYQFPGIQSVSVAAGAGR